MNRTKIASYGTCPRCQKVVAVLSAGTLRGHTAEQRLNPHAVAKVECLGSGERWAEYDADVAAAQANVLPPALLTPAAVTPEALQASAEKVLDLDAVKDKA